MASVYIAVPDGLCLWLKKTPNAIDLLGDALLPASSASILRASVHAMDTFRATISADEKLFVLWNTDFLDSSGSNSWAFVSIDADFGLTRFPDFEKESTKRALKVVSLRLAKERLPNHYRLRTHDGNFKTCTAGNNHPSDQHSLCFWEGDVQSGNSKRFAVLVTGPDDGPVNHQVTKTQEKAVEYCKRRYTDLSKLISLADSTIQHSAVKSACVVEGFREFELAVTPRRSSGVSLDLPTESVPPLVQLERMDTYVSESLTYEDWLRAGSPLTLEQRQIIEANSLARQPLRISGPAGSGKTLLMQLLCMKQLKEAVKAERQCRILYVVHNSEMERSVSERFESLDAADFLIGDQQTLRVATLAQYCSTYLQLAQSDVMDTDAAETKSFQSEIVRTAIQSRFDKSDLPDDTMPNISMFASSPGLLGILVELVVHEIGISIKGHELTHDKAKYIESDVSLSRLHGVLTQPERRFVYEVFEDYYRQTTEEQNVLDADDLAITLLSQLHTPLWNIRRKSEGVDFLFVDETQLFNENERRIFAYLTKTPQHQTHLPIAVALDEAQELKGAVSSGFGMLGIESFVNEHLDNVYRCTPSILKLAFFAIQHTTDLFGVDFPDFTKHAKSLVSDDHHLAKTPELRIGGIAGAGGLGNYIAKRAYSLRSQNLRSVCVVVHADRYWSDAKSAIRKVTGEDPYVLKKRGDVFGVDRPGIVLAHPDQVGGQEFDAVISVGLEEGIVPPKVAQESFAETLRQRALREIYLVFTRARFRLEVVVSVNASLTSLLQPAVANGMLNQVTGR